MTVVFLASCILFYLILRTLRQKNYSPKLLPGKFLKERWNKWNPGIPYTQVSGGSPPNRNEETGYRGAAGAASGTNSNGVHRDTSLRSIITLPAYSPEPKPTEQIIAREGERGGMDVVLEFPETAEEEEARREEQMEALYQIRLQRRREIAEREARRRERMEARARGDYARLEELRREHTRNNNGSSTTLTSAMMLAEHRSRGRERRISSVNYAELGHVRHDGSRIRANSADSDNRPLLDTAGAVGMDGNGRPSVSSARTGRTATRSRGNSASTVVSASTTSEHDDGDVGALHLPPPDYEQLNWEEAPPYESVVVERSEQGPPQLPDIADIPTIRIDAATPAPSNTTADTPATPVQREQQEEQEQRNTTSGGETQQSPPRNS